MDNDRMPKQNLFAYLPDDVGTARTPGRQGGKCLRETLANGLQAMGIPFIGWLHFAQQNNGKDWKSKTRELALWYPPVYPKGMNRYLTDLENVNSF